MLPSNQSQLIQPAKFTIYYSHLAISFEKQIKTIEDQVRKQIKAIEKHGKQLVEFNALIKKRSNEYVTLSNLSIYYTWKNKKTINLKYKLQRGMKNLNYLMDNILYQIFKAVLSISSKSMKQWLRIYRT